MEMPILRPVPFEKGTGYLKTLFGYTRKWELVEDYFIDVPGYHEVRIVSGFILDGASIPKMLRGLLSPVGVLLIPAIFHDYAYRYHNMLVESYNTDHPSLRPISRQEADIIFLKLANRTNDLPLINGIAYLAVKYFGDKAWNTRGDIS